MRHIDIKHKIPELVSDPPAWETFVQLGNLTKLRDNPDGTFRHANYASGLLLYALVKHFKPRNILEIGTGRGYGAFCMAMALRDSGINGKIITLDIKSYTEKQAWALDDSTSPPHIGQYSLKEVWEKYLDAHLRSMVEHRHADSAKGMAQLAHENFHPDFIYIDGDHSYVFARHDFFASLLIANRPFRMLLDDYTPKSNIYGVRKLVDKTLTPIFEMEAIYNDQRWYGEPKADVPISEATYAQVLVDSEKIKQPIDSALPPALLRKTIESHQKWGKLALFTELKMLALRKRLGLIENI